MLTTPARDHRLTVALDHPSCLTFTTIMVQPDQQLSRERSLEIRWKKARRRPPERRPFSLSPRFSAAAVKSEGDPSSGLPPICALPGGDVMRSAPSGLEFGPCERGPTCSPQSPEPSSLPKGFYFIECSLVLPLYTHSTKVSSLSKSLFSSFACFVLLTTANTERGAVN